MYSHNESTLIGYFPESCGDTTVRVQFICGSVIWGNMIYSDIIFFMPQKSEYSEFRRSGSWKLGKLGLFQLDRDEMQNTAAVTQ